MSHDYLKILHIISASLVLGSIFYSCQLWFGMQRAEDRFARFSRIQRQTALVIIPCTLIQLATGFTLISLQHYSLTDGWVGTSIGGFLVLIASWLGFVYFLAASEQEITQEGESRGNRSRLYRRAQSLMLLLCALSLAAMIFSMANRFTSLSGSA